MDTTQIKEPIHVMLVEDHPGYTEVITRALLRHSEIELNHKFGTSEMALRSLQNSSFKPVPDVILLDLNLPGISGIESIPWFQDYTPKSKIIILSQSEKPEDILAAIRLGVSGYLVKTATIPEIINGILTTYKGGASLGPLVAKHVLDTIYKQNNVASGPEKELSKREMEVLTLLGEGLVKKEIADQLNISVNTVVYHIRHIYEKLHVVNAAAAIKTAYTMGLFQPD